MVASGSIVVVCTGNVCRLALHRAAPAPGAGRDGHRGHERGHRGLVGRDMDAGTSPAARPGRCRRGRLRRSGSSPPSSWRAADLVLTAAREHRSAAARLHPSALAGSSPCATSPTSSRVSARTTSPRPAAAALGPTGGGGGRRPAGPRAGSSGDVDVTDPIGGPPSCLRADGRGGRGGAWFPWFGVLRAPAEPRRPPSAGPASGIALRRCRRACARGRRATSVARRWPRSRSRRSAGPTWPGPG